MDSTSASLLMRLRSPGNEQAWDRFVELYTPLIYYWARRAGLQPQDASDLVQEVLALLVKKLPEFQYDQSKSFRGWLRTVTLNKWREVNRKKSLNIVDASQSTMVNVPNPQSAESYWDLDYRRELVARAMEMMKPEFSPATWKACCEFLKSGRPAAEISAESGLSVWTIYSAKARVMKRLRQELDGLLD